jgi:hypothetical protein
MRFYVCDVRSKEEIFIISKKHVQQTHLGHDYKCMIITRILCHGMW